MSGAKSSKIINLIIIIIIINLKLKEGFYTRHVFSGIKRIAGTLTKLPYSSNF